MDHKQEQLISNRRVLHRASDSVEGAAAVALLDADIEAMQSQLQTATTLEDVFRTQGAIRALLKYKRYFTEAPMVDRTN